MSSNATISNRTLSLGDGASPQVYSGIEEIIDISGLGANADLIDVTHFGSGENRDYIGGKGDGVEFSVECNDTGATVQDSLRATSKGTTVNLRYTKTDRSPNESDQFDAVYLGYVENPSPTEQNRITFNFKVTGDFQ